MNKSLTMIGIALLTIVGIGVGGANIAFALIEFDQNVTPDVIFGSGNSNGSFTTDRQNGIEIGIRAKLRFDGPVTCDPQNTFNSNGDGTYSFDAVDRVSCAGWADGDTPEWNFEWSINSDYDDTTGLNLDDLTYELGMDADPSLGTNFLTFDPINVPFADHSIGDNGTANGAGVEAVDAATYLTLLAGKNVAQNSWNYDFFDNPIVFPGTPIEFFDAESDGVYDIYLKAYNGGTEVASVTIQIVVGEPECVVGPNPVAAGAPYTVITSQGIEEKLAPLDSGIYDVSTVCDSLVVYDPSAGFVTGGGWIDSPGGAMDPWNQTFSIDDAGWFDDDDDWYDSDITVADGVATFVGGITGPFSRFDGYRDIWPGTWTAEIDVYLDTAWTAGQGFDYSVAANGSDGNHQRDYIFHVTKDTSSGDLLVAGSNNTNFAPREDLETINHVVVSSSGWYTLQHVFRDDSGVLAVDLNLLDADGNVLFTETRSDPTDTIPSEVGGNRYSWFTFINVAGGIEVDNHQLFIGTTESPSGKATFGFVSKYKKGAQTPDGSTEFQFKAGDLNFHSSSYDWLVVTGSNYAKFKGEGTINGNLAPNGEPYKFKIWAGDNAETGDPDTFRIKIWYEDGGSEVLVYDNGSDQAISAGNIVIHTKKK